MKNEKKKPGKGKTILIILLVLLAFGVYGKLTGGKEADKKEPQETAQTEAAATATASIKAATSAPTNAPTNEPTKEPSTELTAEPTEAPSATPAPTKTPKPTPTASATPKPTKKPTAKPTQKPTKKPTKKPTNTPSPNVQHGELLSLNVNEIDKIVVFHVRIEPSYNNRATVTQNFFNIESIAKMGWFKDYEVQYWAEALMTDGSYSKVIQFVVPASTMELLAAGKIAANRLDLDGWIEMEYILPSLK